MNRRFRSIERAMSQQPKEPHSLIPHKSCEWHHRCLKFCHYLKITRQSKVQNPPRTFFKRAYARVFPASVTLPNNEYASGAA